MSDDPSNARSSPDAADAERPPGLSDAKSEARLRTSESEPRPPGLGAMSPSARLRLQLVLDADSVPPPALKQEPAPYDATELKLARSLGRWMAFCGLWTLALGALTGLSYFTGEGSVATVVVGILASALAVWLLAAALSFLRVARTRGKERRHLISGFALLRSALLLKAILLFSALALACFTFSVAASLLFLR